MKSTATLSEIQQVNNILANKRELSDTESDSGSLRNSFTPPQACRKSSEQRPEHSYLFKYCRTEPELIFTQCTCESVICAFIPPMQKIFQNPTELAVALNANEINNVILKWRRAENAQIPSCLMNSIFKYCFQLGGSEVKVAQVAALSFLLMVIPRKNEEVHTNWLVSSKLLSQCLIEIGCHEIFKNEATTNDMDNNRRIPRDLHVALNCNEIWSITALLKVVRQCYLDPFIWMASLRAQHESESPIDDIVQTLRIVLILSVDPLIIKDSLSTLCNSTIVCILNCFRELDRLAGDLRVHDQVWIMLLDLIHCDDVTDLDLAKISYQLHGSDFMLHFIDTIFCERFSPQSLSASMISSSLFSVYSVFQRIITTLEDCCLQSQSCCYWNENESIYAMSYSILSFLKDCERNRYFHQDVQDSKGKGGLLNVNVERTSSYLEAVNDLTTQCENFYYLIKRRRLEDDMHEMIISTFDVIHLFLSAVLKLYQ